MVVGSISSTICSGCVAYYSHSLLVLDVHMYTCSILLWLAFLLRPGNYTRELHQTEFCRNGNLRSLGNSRNAFGLAETPNVQMTCLPDSHELESRSRQIQSGLFFKNILPVRDAFTQSCPPPPPPPPEVLQF